MQQDPTSFLQRGFRPFFLLAGLFGCVALGLWLWSLVNGSGPQLTAIDVRWHAHEMIHGYLMAVVAGFVLTAVPNWTGRPPVQGLPLALLVVLWLGGRLTALYAGGHEGAASLLHHGFAFLLATIICREILAAGNWRNLPVCILIWVLAVSDPGHHHAVEAGWDPVLFHRVALGCMALLIMLIGGRVTPLFTRNWMKREGIESLPADGSAVDGISLGLGLAAVLAWITFPWNGLTAALLAAAGTAHLVRVLRWRIWATWREPLVTLLHLGYAWIPIWLLLSAVSIVWPALMPPSGALHALTAGALSTMPLAMMTRAILGHTGRPLTANSATCVIFAAVLIAGVTRVVAHVLPVPYTDALMVSGGLWAGAHALFLIAYAPMLLRGTSPSDRPG